MPTAPVPAASPAGAPVSGATGPRAAGLAAPLDEVACDESGAEGEKLIGGNTDVFAHASVRLTPDLAVGCVQELRGRIRSPALEYKANHLLRDKNRAALIWLLGPSGPLPGNASVQLTEKAFFVVGRLAALMTAAGPGAARPGAAGQGAAQQAQARVEAVALYQAGPEVLGARRWLAFLAGFNDLMRAKQRREPPGAVGAWFGLVEQLRAGRPPGLAGQVVERLWRTRAEAEEFFAARPAGCAKLIPPLDPLIPAIIQAVARWSGDGRAVSVIHDQQTTLTEERIERIKAICNGAHSPGAPGARLASLRLADSAADARVQVADFLAGVARKIASDALNDRADTELTALLRPYVDPGSAWGDDRSWSLLSPPRASPA